MAISSVIANKVSGLLAFFLGCFRRLLCFMNRRKRTNSPADKDDLPFQVVSHGGISPAPGSSAHAQPSPYSGLLQTPPVNADPTVQNIPAYNGSMNPHQNAAWDAWAGTRIGDTVGDKISDYRAKVTAESERRRVSSTTADPPESPANAKENDLFSELAPQIKKPKKEGIGELGEIADNDDNDEQNWDFDESELDVSSVLKEAKQKERHERNQKKKAEQMAKKSGSGHHTNIHM